MPQIANSECTHKRPTGLFYLPPSPRQRLDHQKRENNVDHQQAPHHPDENVKCDAGQPTVLVADVAGPQVLHFAVCQ